MAEKKSGGILLVLLIIVIVGIGVYFLLQSSDESTPLSTETEEVDYESNIEDVMSNDTDPISYSIDGVDASLSKETVPFNYTVEQFESMAAECGATHDAGYFENLVNEFKDYEKIMYKFKYNGESQDPDTYVVTLLPNVHGYSTIAEFKSDFDLCYAGGDMYPLILNEDWLVFSSSCGTGLVDTTETPIGCSEIKPIVEPNLKLK